MEIGKTVRDYPTPEPSIVYNDRENYYKLKRFVRYQVALEKIRDWQRSGGKTELTDSLKRFLNYINLVICQTQ